jgi:hypothetical protein
MTFWDSIFLGCIVAYWDSENKKELTVGIIQCPKRFHQTTTLGLIGPKEGKEIKSHGMKDKGPI